MFYVGLSCSGGFNDIPARFAHGDLKLSEWSGCIAAMTRSNMERVATQHLRSIGSEVLLPQYRDDRGRARIMFRNYILVETSAANWWSVCRTKGVIKVLMDSDRPALIPERSVARLRARMDDAGFIDLNRELKLADEPRHYALGQSLRVTRGPYEGQFVIYQGMSNSERVKVLLCMLGRNVEKQFSHRDVEAA